MAQSLKRGMWRLEIPPERLVALRDDESFRQILALGRLLNSLRFLQFAFLGMATHRNPSILWFRLKQWLVSRLRSIPSALLKRRPDRPAARRQRIVSFLFVAATLYEGFELLKRMGKNFRQKPAWEKGIAPILQDRLFDRLFKETLHPLRNGIVFHFFDDALDEPLQRLPAEAVTFVSSVGSRQGQLVYELSDRLALDLFIGREPSADAQVKRAETLMIRTRDLLIQIDRAGEALIAEYAHEQGFVLVRGPRAGTA